MLKKIIQIKNNSDWINITSSEKIICKVDNYYHGYRCIEKNVLGVMFDITKIDKPKRMIFDIKKHGLELHLNFNDDSFPIIYRNVNNNEELVVKFILDLIIDYPEIKESYIVFEKSKKYNYEICKDVIKTIYPNIKIELLD